ncbi:unnamed protein product, partial [Ectocarpus fasciculatus]
LCCAGYTETFLCLFQKAGAGQIQPSLKKANMTEEPSNEHSVVWSVCSSVVTCCPTNRLKTANEPRPLCTNRTESDCRRRPQLAGCGSTFYASGYDENGNKDGLVLM